MRLAAPDFIRRFLIHVLPDGFHRIRHYGLLASSTRKANITNIRALLCVQQHEHPGAYDRVAHVLQELPGCLPVSLVDSWVTAKLLVRSMPTNKYSLPSVV